MVSFRAATINARVHVLVGSSGIAVVAQHITSHGEARVRRDGLKEMLMGAWK